MGTVVTALLVDEHGGHDRDRPRRRLARVPDPRRCARAADPRSLARRRARARRAALDRGGRAASAPLGDHARGRHRAGRRGPHARRSTRFPATSTSSARTGSPTSSATSESWSSSRLPTDDPELAVQSLVDAANGAGGIDNITVVLFEILDGDPVPHRRSSRRSRAGRRYGGARARARDGSEPTLADAAAPVQRHGAGAGGRWLALARDPARRSRSPRSSSGGACKR